jgi:hypothetical protein
MQSIKNLSKFEQQQRHTDPALAQNYLALYLHGVALPQILLKDTSVYTIVIMNITTYTEMMGSFESRLTVVIHEMSY